jgi:hypothetical protein
MDLYKAIRVLYAEKSRLEAAIASLEELLASKGGAASAQLDELGKKRRGRKSMSAEERREVSQRMTKYWAQRRAGKLKTAGTG